MFSLNEQVENWTYCFFCLILVKHGGLICLTYRNLASIFKFTNNTQQVVAQPDQSCVTRKIFQSSIHSPGTWFILRSSKWKQRRRLNSVEDLQPKAETKIKQNRRGTHAYIIVLSFKHLYRVGRSIWTDSRVWAPLHGFDSPLGKI